MYLTIHAIQMCSQRHLQSTSAVQVKIKNILACN